MTNIEAMKLALDELEVCRGNVPIWVKAIAALRQAISEAEQADINLNCKSVQKRLATSWGYVKAEQEPVAYIIHTKEGDTLDWDTDGWRYDVEPLYTAPPQREWVSLTDDERGWCAAPTYEETVARVEAKLKEKNS